MKFGTPVFGLPADVYKSLFHALTRRCEDVEMRMDKWLWAARFFKTRALASRACELSRIQSNGVAAKPAREVRIGDHLRVQNDGGIFEIEVLDLSEIRGPASAAQKLYRESEASLDARMKAAEEQRAIHQFAPTLVGRPTKRDRRRIIQFRSGH